MWKINYFILLAEKCHVIRGIFIVLCLLGPLGPLSENEFPLLDLQFLVRQLRQPGKGLLTISKAWASLPSRNEFRTVLLPVGY